MFLKITNFQTILNMVLFKWKQAMICCQNPKFVENSSSAKMFTFYGSDPFRMDLKTSDATRFMRVNIFSSALLHIDKPFLGLPSVVLCRSETSHGYLWRGDGFPGITFQSKLASQSTLLFSLSPSFIELAPSSSSLKPHKGLRLSHLSTEHDISPVVVSY